MLKRYVKWVVLLTILSCLPLITNGYHQYLINLIFVNFLVSLGLAVLLGYCGQFAFASAAFLGIGAYTVGLSMVYLSLPYWIALLFAALLSMLFAFVVGLVGLRLSRYYLAITTIAFTLSMRFFYVNAGGFTFGPSGFSIPVPKMWGISFNSDYQIYYLLVVVDVILSFLTINILKSKIGRAFIAIRDKEEAAAAAAINVKNYKMLAFIMSGVLGGVAGGLYSVVVGRITPDEFGLMQIIFHFMIVVLGGLGNITGLVISTITITLLPELIRSLKDWQEIVYGGVIIVIILFAPSGLYGLIQKYLPFKFRERLHGNIEKD